MRELNFDATYDSFCCGVTHIGKFKLGKGKGAVTEEAVADFLLKLENWDPAPCVTCTTVSYDSIREERTPDWEYIETLLKKAGFVVGAKFVNRDSGNTVSIWHKFTPILKVRR